MNQSPLIKVRFEIKKIRTCSEENKTFRVLEVVFKSYVPIDKDFTSKAVVVGNFISAFEDDEFEAEGMWVYNKIFGKQFRVINPKRILPSSQKGLIAFIQRFVKGIGKKTATAIVETLGIDALAKIEEDDQCLLTIPGMGPLKAKKIYDRLMLHRYYEDVAYFVVGNGGSYKLALQAYETYGKDAINRIKSNPYCLLHFRKVGFEEIDRMAHALGTPFDSHQRARAGLLDCIDWFVKKQGDLYVNFSELLKQLPAHFKRYGAYQELITNSYSKKQWKELIDELVQVDILVLDGHKIYLKPFHFIEDKIVELTKKHLLAEKKELCSLTQIDEFLTEYQFPLDTQQKKAVKVALTNGLSILTGLPGTGKTQTINGIIQCIKKYNPDAKINLCAATGRASKCMNLFTGMVAKTIHRLIGLNNFRKQQSVSYLKCDYLIIDEFSMVDAPLYYKLLQTLSLETRILLVGDYEQIPSVGPGLLLRDFIQSKVIPTVSLEKIHRQKNTSEIVLNAHKILKGTNSHTGLVLNSPKNDFYFIRRTTPISIADGIVDSVQRLVENGTNLKDIQILTPIKSGDLGITILNQKIQNVLNPYQADRPQYEAHGFIFRENDRVIQSVNNYDLEVFNGEIGIITSIDGWGMDAEITVDFGDRKIVYDSLLLIDELELAYAITIHRSQGSEFPIMIMPFHKMVEGLLTRNLVYTAWTRAKEKVINLGSVDVLDEAIARTTNVHRNSQIKEKLIFAMKDQEIA